jgi:Immunoglobulin-like domain of bacterial spore germination
MARGTAHNKYSSGWTVALGIVAIVLLGVSIYAKITRKTPTIQPNIDAFLPKAIEKPPTVTTTVAPSPTTTPTTPAPTPAPASSSSGLVTIASPATGSKVTSGTVVTGTAQVGADRLYWRVKGEKSGQLGSGPVTLPTNTKPQSFQFTLVFDHEAMAGDSGELQVFSRNPSDDSEINQASVAIGF